MQLTLIPAIDRTVWIICFGVILASIAISLDGMLSLLFDSTTHYGRFNHLSFRGYMPLTATFISTSLLYAIMLLLLRLPPTKAMITVIGIHGENIWLEYYMFTFTVLNFVGILAYYATVYNSEGTWKPAWTENLG